MENSLFMEEIRCYIKENRVEAEGFGDDKQEVGVIAEKGRFSKIFFRLYDSKIASGEISFSKMGMNKGHFNALCNDLHHTMEKEEVKKLCITMRLSETEAGELLDAAGYELDLSKEEDLLCRYFIEAGIHNYSLYSQVLEIL